MGRLRQAFAPTVQAGRHPEIGLDRFEAEQAGMSAKLADLQRQVVPKENQLSALLGRKPAQISRGLPLDEQPIFPEAPAGLPSELLPRRLDILQAEPMLAAATA